LIPKAWTQRLPAVNKNPEIKKDLTGIPEMGNITQK
jgi:hypothetical protein